jgi:DNA-binding beta-propeller fold protein YncE
MNVLRARRPASSSALVLLVVAGLVSVAAVSSTGCKKTPPPGPTATPLSTGSATASSSASSGANAPPAPKPGRSTSASLARDTKDKALYLADEDASLLRKVPLPLEKDGPFPELSLEGPPAQVLVRHGEIFVTQRDPSKLLVVVDETDQPDGKLRVAASVPLPGDAFAMALSPDERTLLVSSAWTHQITVVDRASRAVVATLDVPREPRGIVFASDGKRAYVTHLIGTALTRIDLDGASSKATRVPLPAGTTHAPRNYSPQASQAWMPAISADGSRLFVARHSLGTVGSEVNGLWNTGRFWWGTSTIDTLLTADESPLTPPRAKVAMIGRFGAADGLPPTPTGADVGAMPMHQNTSFIQPRDAVVRRRTNTLLVVSEGTDSLTEHPLDNVDPGSVRANVYQLGDGYLTGPTKQPTADRGSAPQAIALLSDEQTAYVWSRGSREIMAVALSGSSVSGTDARGKSTMAIAGPFPEPMSADAAAGRRLFHFATDSVMSGDLGCAGCHPEGRDDGFVWRQGRHKEPQQAHPHDPVFFVQPKQLGDPEDDGRARQTPMLAGRVSAAGPYGWHAQNKDLEGRLLEGFSLHRWTPPYKPPTAYEKAFRLKQLKAYLQTGLRKPPVDKSPLTPEEEKGRAIFEDDKTLCKNCHPPATEFTTRAPTPLTSPLPTRAGFTEDEDQAFKVPSLLFVGGTPPYYHDGSTSTLTELIDKNGTRMGNTAHLSAEERKALVAYLQRL